MDKLIKFIDLYWPVEYCNFNCEYCYVHQHRENKGNRYVCSHTPEEIRKALSRKRLGGTCLINICAGGETLLEESIVPVIYALLEEGHYIGVVTNGTVKRTIYQLLDFPVLLRRRLFLKISFHYGELKRRQLLEPFFDTVNKIKEKGVSFTLELPAYDEFLKESSQIRLLSEKYTRGGIPHVSILRDENKKGYSVLSKYSLEELKNKWAEFHSQLFDIRCEVMEKKYKGFCYAGDWTFTADLETGVVRQCYNERIIDNLYANPDAKLNICAVGNHCHSDYCYVCQVFLTLGVIPELDIKCRYDKTRDRDGKWLNQETKRFFSQRLYENNKQYHPRKKQRANKQNREYEQSIYISPQEFMRQTISKMKNYPLKENYELLEAKKMAGIIYPVLPKELLWMEHMGEPVYGENNISICAGIGQNCHAKGDEIGIVGVLADHIWYDALDLFQQDWILKNRTYRWRSWDKQNIPDTILGVVPKADNIILVLEKNKWRGICMISFDGNCYTVDTYGDVDDDVIFIQVK